MYSFPEKNRIIQAHASGHYFDADRELFLRHCSNRRLEHEIARANPFTYHDMDARLLSDLLDKLSEEDILAHRETFYQQETTPVITPRKNKAGKSKVAVKKKRNKKSSRESAGVIT